MCVALTGFGLSVQAQNNTLAVVSNSIAQGGEVDLSISLENESPISGGQFTVTLPQGVSVKDVVLNSERSNGHTVEYRWNETKRSLLILLYAQPTATLKGHDGVLCTLSLSAAEEATAGDFPVTLGDVRLAMDAITPSECTTTDGVLAIIARYEIIVDAAEGGIATGGGIFDADASVVLTATPDEGYHFVRWSDGSTANPYVFSASEDVSLTAEFAPNVYHVIYMVDGMEYRTEEVLYGSIVTAIAAPVKEGHTFSGWSGVPATMPAKDVTVNGSFTVNSYTVTYKVAGEIYKTESFVYGAAITVAESPVKEGHTFSGWSEIPATMPAGNITVSGSFAVSSYTVTYMVDGEVYKTESIAYGSKVTAMAEPVKEGHTFGGWSGVPATMPAKDVTVSGSFTVNSYTVTYKVDGEVYRTDSYAYGTAITAAESPVKEGYTFSGWSEIPATMPAENITVSGSFAVNSYTVTYMVDGEVYKTENIAYGSKVTAMAEPVKEGHTFGGWSGVPATMPAEDVTVSGSFTVNSYTITYMVDGEVYKTESYVYGAAITAAESPVKEGHTFSGWSEIPATMPAGNITISGSFAVNSYTVTFVLEGEVFAEYTLQYGSVIEVPEAPQSEGFTFSGWGKVPETMPARDLVFEGSYMKNPYTIIYIVDGVEYHRASVEYGSVITLIAIPVKEGHTFSGWSEIPATMPAENITVSGSFAVNSYTVTYMVDGEVYKTENIAYGSKVTAMAVPVKEGHTFGGWSGVPATMPAKDVTVNGSFTVNSYTVTYKVDGEVYKTESYVYGAAITAAESPVKEGYTFSGWSEIPATMPAGNITVSGSFAVNSYTVTYMVDGEVYKTESIAYGSKVTAIAVPVKEGHTFGGWSGVPATMPAKDVTVGGSFTVNSYTITYMVDGEVYKTESYVYGAAITAAESPVKEGYTFSGWSEIPATMPAGNITVSGSFAVNSYTITYMVDGEVYKTENIAYGSKVTAMAEPVKEGHTFSGWSEIPELMPAEDVTISGSFIVNKYLVTFKIGDEVIASNPLEYGATIVAPEAPEKEGHTFNGWGEVLETVPASDVAYEGSYTVNIYKVYYYVGEELVHTAEVAYGEAIPEYVYEPTEEGYTFIGWKGDAHEAMPAHDVTYTAMLDDLPTRLRQLTNDNGQWTIYDLSGRKITVEDLRELSKGGIYIVNGKKVIMQ